MRVPSATNTARTSTSITSPIPNARRSLACSTTAPPTASFPTTTTTPKPTPRTAITIGTARPATISYTSRPLGDWTDGDSKIGSLRKSLPASGAPAGQPSRSRRCPHRQFRFRQNPEDQAISTAAYLANGLRGNSDAYRPGTAPVPGGQMFWCTQDDRQNPSIASTVRLVQFGNHHGHFLPIGRRHESVVRPPLGINPRPAASMRSL